MKISAIVTTFNSEQFVLEALQSVIDQTVAVDEILLVDDASADRTVEIVREQCTFVKVFVNDTNEGPSFSRNKGVTNACGDVIAFLDADDRWLPNKISWQKGMLETDPALEIVAGLTQLFFMQGTDGRQERQLADQPHFNAYLSAMLIRKKLFQRIGNFDATQRRSEDHDWILRAREAGIAIRVMQQTVLQRRIHENNLTGELKFEETGMIGALKRSLDRRRQTGIAGNLSPLRSS